MSDVAKSLNLLFLPGHWFWGIFLQFGSYESVRTLQFATQICVGDGDEMNSMHFFLTIGHVAELQQQLAIVVGDQPSFVLSPLLCCYSILNQTCRKLIRLGFESFVHTLVIISCRVSTQPSLVHLEGWLWVSNGVLYEFLVNSRTLNEQGRRLETWGIYPSWFFIHPPDLLYRPSSLLFKFPKWRRH